MKSFTIFACLIVGISAAVLPGSELQPAATRNERIVTDLIVSAIEDLRQDIRDAGLDPLWIESETYKYELPVSGIFSAAAYLEKIFSTGLSDIIVTRMDFSILLSRLIFEIEMPHIHLSAGKVTGQVSLFGETLEAEGDGRLDVRGIRVSGEVRVNIGIISGISISRLDIQLSIGSLNSNIRLAIQGNNYSVQVNDLINNKIPQILDEYGPAINELISIVLLEVINGILQDLLVLA